MAVRIVPLESGRLMVKWNSMEKEAYNCVNYGVVVDAKEFSKTVALVPAEKGKIDYYAIIELPENLVSAALMHKIIIKVVALGPKNKSTNVEAVAVYP